MIVVLVLLGGAIGAPARYLLDRFIQSRLPPQFPTGTMTINVLGCFVLGLLAGSAPSAGHYALLGTGFCGGFTTFSTFSVETVELLQGRRPVAATGYLLASVIAGITAAAAGYAIG